MAVPFFESDLIDISEEIAGIQGLTKNTSLETFSGSWAMKRAVEHALLIVAEAAKHIRWR